MVDMVIWFIDVPGVKTMDGVSVYYLTRKTPGIHRYRGKEDNSDSGTRYTRERMQYLLECIDKKLLRYIVTAISVFKRQIELIFPFQFVVTLF